MTRSGRQAPLRCVQVPVLLSWCAVCVSGASSWNTAPLERHIALGLCGSRLCEWMEQSRWLITERERQRERERDRERGGETRRDEAADNTRSTSAVVKLIDAELHSRICWFKGRGRSVVPPRKPTERASPPDGVFFFYSPSSGRREGAFFPLFPRMLCSQQQVIYSFSKTSDLQLQLGG